jgi:hypothetical protein
MFIPMLDCSTYFKPLKKKSRRIRKSRKNVYSRPFHVGLSLVQGRKPENNLGSGNHGSTGEKGLFKTIPRWHKAKNGYFESPKQS